MTDSLHITEKAIERLIEQIHSPLKEDRISAARLAGYYRIYQVLPFLIDIVRSQKDPEEVIKEARNSINMFFPTTEHAKNAIDGVSPSGEIPSGIQITAAEEIITLFKDNKPEALNKAYDYWLNWGHISAKQVVGEIEVFSTHTVGYITQFYETPLDDVKESDRRYRRAKKYVNKYISTYLNRNNNE